MPDSGGQPGATGDVRLTYQKLGERLRISAEAARILTRRRGWRRLAPNRKGAPAIVVVPEDELDAEDWRPDQGSPPDEGRTHPDSRVDIAEQRAVEAGQRADAALAVADRALAQLADAQAALTAERLRGDALRQQLVRADARSDELRTEARAAREHADELQAGQELMMQMHARALAEAAEQFSRVREAAEGLRQAEADWKARGRLARLRAAWLER
jgi:hypothetical protein